MKKGFGIFFLVVGPLNLIIAMATIIGAPETAANFADKIGRQILMGIGFIGLGYWLYNSAKSSNDNG